MDDGFYLVTSTIFVWTIPGNTMEHSTTCKATICLVDHWRDAYDVLLVKDNQVVGLYGSSPCTSLYPLVMVQSSLDI